MPDMITSPDAIKGEIKIHSASLHVVAVFDCPCGHSPLVLTGTSDMKTCPRCGASYMFASISHTARENGQFDTNVQVGRLSALTVPRPRGGDRRHW